MSQPKPLLTQLCTLGKPLAEVGVMPADGEDIADLINAFNSLGPDVAAQEGRYNSLVRSGKVVGRLTIELDATREALERLFGWRLARVPLSSEADTYCWRELSAPAFYPQPLVGRVRSMGLSQPGANDDGNDDTVPYGQARQLGEDWCAKGATVRT